MYLPDNMCKSAKIYREGKIILIVMYRMKIQFLKDYFQGGCRKIYMLIFEVMKAQKLHTATLAV